VTFLILPPNDGFVWVEVQYKEMLNCLKLMKIYLQKIKNEPKKKSRVDSKNDENFNFVGTLIQNIQLNMYMFG
jgi:hypothetical protein